MELQGEADREEGRDSKCEKRTGQETSPAQEEEADLRKEEVSCKKSKKMHKFRTSLSSRKKSSR